MEQDSAKNLTKFYDRSSA